MDITQEGLKTNVPDFRAGDTVKIHVKVVEGDSERIQLFDGIVIARRGRGISETFTVRKMSFGVGVERIFPVHSPRVEKIEITKRSKVRRAKLFYLRDLSGKAARLQELGLSTPKKVETDETAPAEVPAAEAKPAEPKK